MQYQIVAGKNIGQLQSAVRRAISEGWRPLGGVCAWSGGMLVMQAMTK